MRRIPIVPTFVVIAAVAVMIALGVWQLQRAAEKDRLLAEYARNAALPALDLDPLLDRDARDLPPLAFRRVLVSCRADRAEPRLRGGASRDGLGGWNYLVPCRPGASGLGGRLWVNAGGSRTPDQSLRLSLNGLVAGTLGAVGEEDGPITVTAARPVPPLAAAVPPRFDDVPNNHLFYVFQWFFFAAAALVIYWLALRRRLSAGSQDPKSQRP